MAVASSSVSKDKAAAAKKEKQKEYKRTNCPGVRLHHGRIYDSENGKTCHQIWRESRGCGSVGWLELPQESEAALSRKPGKENSFDRDCDSNLNSRNLPRTLNKEKSKKMKREGLKEIPSINGDDGVSLRMKSPKKPKVSEEISEKEKFKVSEEVSRIDKPKEEGEKNEDGLGNLGGVKALNCVKNAGVGSNLEAVSEFRGVNKCITEVPLPQSATLTTVAGAEIPPEDVGHALQFLEFCAAFGKVLDLKKGQAECIIRELMGGRSRRRGLGFPMVQIHIQLLSLIQKDMGEESPLSSTSGKNSWLQALSKCVSNSKCPLNDIPSNCFDCGGDGYHQLNGSKKLKLLNFLCDEALGTTVLRNWIDDQNSEFVEKVKESREKFVAAKEKQLQDEVAKAIITNGAPLSISEHEAIVSEIKRKAAEALSEMTEAKGMAFKKKHRSDAVRTEPIIKEDNGRAVWRLKGYNGGRAILLQEVNGTPDAVSPSEKWFAYDADQVPAVEKYLSSKRHCDIQFLLGNDFRDMFNAN
ncbi:DDT domain-containing protein [Citrus sinensis]|nr:DDT domain-containing protein [Citrus sinensis]